MTVTAPHDGIIVYPFDIRRELMNRPVEVGQELLQIASIDGEWVEEVDVSDNDMGPVLDAQAQARRGEGRRPEAGRRQAGSLLRLGHRP